MTYTSNGNREQLLEILVVLIGMLVLFGVVSEENVIEAVSAMMLFMLVKKYICSTDDK